MIDHIGVPVSDYEAGKRFYTQALAPIGYGVVMEVTAEQTGGHAACGFGRDGKPDFWIGSGEIGSGLHVAFQVVDRAAVHGFYDAALAAGGTDNGGPGLRPHYHPNYYAAFVRDLDGANIEVVCHKPGRMEDQKSA